MNSWMFYAVLSATAAGTTAILAKVGIQGVRSEPRYRDSHRGGACVSWGIVFARGESSSLRDLKARTILFLVLSGVATGLSWLAYFKALQLAPASRVAAVDKLQTCRSPSFSRGSRSPSLYRSASGLASA